MSKHWHIQNIKSTFKSTFGNAKTIIAFLKNTFLKWIVGGNPFLKHVKTLKPIKGTVNRKCTPCYLARSLCCKLVKFFKAHEQKTSKTWTRTMDPDHGPEPWTLDPDPENLDPKNPGPWKTWETTGYGKMIRRPHIITYYLWKSAKKRLVSRPSEKVAIEAW